MVRFSVYGLGATHSFVLSEDLFLDLSAKEGIRTTGAWETTTVCRPGQRSPTPWRRDGSSRLLWRGGGLRDALIETDERNEAMAGIGADWILSNRLTLGFEQTFRWLSYLNPAKPFSGKGQGGMAGKGGKGGNGDNGGNGCDGGKDCSEAVRSERVGATSAPDQGPGNGNELNRLYPPRDNLLMVTGLDLDVFILPSLTGRVSAAIWGSGFFHGHGILQRGSGWSRPVWTPATQWLVGGEATWCRTNTTVSRKI